MERMVTIMAKRQETVKQVLYSLFKAGWLRKGKTGIVLRDYDMNKLDEWLFDGAERMLEEKDRWMDLTVETFLWQDEPDAVFLDTYYGKT